MKFALQNVRFSNTTGLPGYGFLLLLLLTLFWGVNWPIIKMALDDVPVLTFRAVCLVGGAIVIFSLGKILGQSLTVPRHLWRLLIVCSFFNITGWHILTGYGIDLTSSGRAAIIAYTMPLWTAPLGIIVLGEPITWRRTLALIFGTLGLGVLLVSDFEKLGAAPLGLLFMLLGAMSWACGTVFQKKVIWGVPTIVLVGWQYVLGGIPIGISAFLFVDYDTVSFPSLLSLFSISYNIIFSFVFCYYAYYEVVRIFPVGVATLGTLATPVVGVFSGALLLGETLGWEEYIALMLVMLALGFPAFWGFSWSKLGGNKNHAR